MSLTPRASRGWVRETQDREGYEDMLECGGLPPLLRFRPHLPIDRLGAGVHPVKAGASSRTPKGVRRGTGLAEGMRTQDPGIKPIPGAPNCFLISDIHSILQVIYECLATSSVGLDPPRSGVVTFSARAHFTDCFNTADSSFQPKNSSNMPEARTASKGLAIPFPAMLGAEPWTGSKSEVRPGWMLADGARPSPPASWAARSLMMSPKRLQVTMTSNWLGSRTSSMARVSM